VREADVAASTLPRAAGGEADTPAAVAAVQALAADLYGRLSARPGNLVFSPLSVAVALAMTRIGARGRTATEMGAVLHAGSEGFDRGMNALLRHLEDRTGPGTHRGGGGNAEVSGEAVLDAASSLWGQRDLDWQRPFLDVLARHYGAGMRLVDYRQDARSAASAISSWTSERTHGRIPQIVPAGVLDALTRLVVVNALYFRAPWREPFDPPSAHRPFTTADGARVDVPMMSQDLYGAGYASGEGWRAARLAYAGGELAMAVVVPDAGVGLRSVEGSLHGGGLRRMLAGLEPVDAIRVEMPRWTYRCHEPLNEHLAALGMPTAFDPRRADLGGMTTQEPLHISHVLHEAFVAVDEHGTEAAAATAVVARTLSLREPPRLTLTADRPFLFVVFDQETTTPLFLGRVSDPTG